MLVSVREYAEAHNRKPDSIRQSCLRGRFKTARKIGSAWVLDRDEPMLDYRCSDPAAVLVQQGNQGQQTTPMPVNDALDKLQRVYNVMLDLSCSIIKAKAQGAFTGCSQGVIEDEVVSAATEATVMLDAAMQDVKYAFNALVRVSQYPDGTDFISVWSHTDKTEK